MLHLSQLPFLGQYLWDINILRLTNKCILIQELSRRFALSSLQNLNATTSCKSAWDTLPYFGINGLSMILCLWSPLHPLSKLLAIQDHAQNLEEQLWMGGRREVSIISHRPVTRSDLKQERSFFRGSVSTFLQLVVASVEAKHHVYVKFVPRDQVSP